MQRHRRRRATKRSPARPLRPEGGDGTPLSSVLLLLADVQGRRVATGHPCLLCCSSSPMSPHRLASCLESRGVALATNIIVFMEVST